MKELQKQTGVRIKVVAGDENTENKEAVILIEESFASGQVVVVFCLVGSHNSNETAQ